MQATELCTYVLSIDDYGQVRSVGVNEGGLHVDIHIGFRPFPRAWFNRTQKWVRTKCYANQGLRSLRDQGLASYQSWLAIDLRQLSNPARFAL